MEDILYQLFSGDYDITLKPDKKQQELCAQISVEADKIQAAFGDAFLDRLCELEGGTGGLAQLSVLPLWLPSGRPPDAGSPGAVGRDDPARRSLRPRRADKAPSPRELSAKLTEGVPPDSAD